MFIFSNSNKIKESDVDEQQRRIIVDIVCEMIKHFPINDILEIPYGTSDRYSCEYCPFKDKCANMPDVDKVSMNCKERLYIFTKGDYDG